MTLPTTRPSTWASVRAGRHLPLAAGFPATHAELEEHHNQMEHARNAHARPPDSPNTTGGETYEPLDDYDLDVMPRGV
jgi:hypothetical protein